ncbi:hypothetical protein [Clostridium botulinum]|uniref:Lipoprotein n=1 Tax=Clostridium botulinum TaxID=1491 RepID=A0A9Q1ZAZ8_CLOBO|nr:hypothetical protein [Clostridium botulinum]AEB77093.1 conserved lipoprotein, putative [Clostridium botulinum BKT015925]KEI00669.1 hypothetical protein Z953_09805 [Clostridium botulinum D str. 16868]KEI05876.1 hypothetical protein Y848_00250 [Clostridium botulinum C/D str. Sp77]KLU75537.1 hypothetical protein CBC3_08540 [Clostridium botulinum V891]KOA78681.1 hypothetical protein ADU77_05680 [Clostridium botulinum]
MHQIKNLLSFLLIFILTITITGCNKRPIISPGKIVPPENYDIAISGEWIIQKYYPTGGSPVKNKNIEDKIGKSLYIGKDKLELLDKTCNSPNFKIKTVDSTSYLASNYSITPSTLGIGKSDIQVITVSNKDTYFTSFIKLSENSLIATLDDSFFLLTRKSGKIEYKNNTTINDKSNFFNFPKNLDSGLLLGLKSYVPGFTLSYDNNSQTIPRPVYRTIWINFDNPGIKDIYEIPHFVYARKTGFWYITTKDVSTTDYKKYKIYTYPLTKNNNPKLIETSIKSDIINKGQSYYVEDVYFVGDDYISLESKEGSLNKDNTLIPQSLLRVDPIDTFNSNKDYSLSISKLMGEQGIKSLKQGASAYINSLDFNERNKLNPTPCDKFFGVMRKNGKWILRGRLEYFYGFFGESPLANFADFDIPIIPPKELIGYDLLFPNWNIIKKKVPDALDAYSSPDKNFVVVLTHSKILIYDIINGDLNNTPLKTVNLKNNEEVIMSQWATGSYVKTWDDQMRKLIK